MDRDWERIEEERERERESDRQTVRNTERDIHIFTFIDGRTETQGMSKA